MLRNFSVSSKSQNLEPFGGPRRNNSTNQKEGKWRGIRFFDMFIVRGAAAKTVIPQEMGYRETVSSARYMKRAGMFMLKSLWVKSFFLAFC